MRTWFEAAGPRGFVVRSCAMTVFVAGAIGSCGGSSEDTPSTGATGAGGSPGIDTGGGPAFVDDGGVQFSATAGFASAVLVREASALEGLRQAVHQGAGPHFAQVKVVAEKEAITLPPREGTLLKNRFREALLGASASLQ